jgi:L-asparaginase II
MGTIIDNPSELPWQPIFTIERSGRKEVTVYGIVCVVEGQAGSTRQNIAAVRAIRQVGDIDYQLWSRSLLKPWQLIQHLDILKSNYPSLKEEHLAFFMASHSAEPHHLEMLEEVMAITGASEEMLKCPQAAPLSSETREQIKSEDGQKAMRRYHNCSGKHIGYLSAIKAVGGNAENYLRPEEAHHVRLVKVLSELTGRPTASMLSTTDGCQLPNYALSVFEMAYLYQSLLSKLPVSFNDSQIQACSADYHQLGELMNKYPRAISGGGRVDYRFVSQDLLGATIAPVVAKEGADGLLGVGIGPCERYPHGLGICIKLSSGFDNRHMELVLRQILTQLEIIGTPPEKRKTPRDVKTDHIKTHFHW